MGLGANLARNLKPLSDSNMPELAVIMRATRADDGAGGYTEEWTELTNDEGIPIVYRCRILPIVSTMIERAERLVGERLTTRTPYAASFQPDVPLLAEDQFYCSDQLYEVHEVIDDHSFQVVTRAIVSREG